MLADVLYGLLVVATVFIVIVIFRVIRKIRHSSGIPSERLLVMTFAMLGGLALLFFFLKGHINDLRVSNGEVQKTAQQLFVEKIYPPLAGAQSQLDFQLKQLAILQKRIFELSRNHPQQSFRLQFAYNIWKFERQGLTQLKSRVDRAVRIAMGVHRVSDPSFVENAFNREAVDWEKIITDRLKQYHGSQLKVSNSMIDNVMLQNKNLNKVRRGKHAILTAEGLVIKSEFDPRTVAPLMAYLEQTVPDVFESFTSIAKEVNTATQKRQEVRNYSLENPDLGMALKKVSDGWLRLESKGIYYRDQLLHAIQAEYLAVLLGTNKKDSQILRLKKSISEHVFALHDDLTQSRIILEKSYKTAPR